MRSHVMLSVSILACTGLTACSKSTPTQPSTSVSAPTPASPVNSAQLRQLDQPVTLVVQNAVATGTAVLTYTFEVATDAAFAAKVQTKDGVPEGSGGQTSVKLDTLPANADYYWHVRAQTAATSGAFGPSYKFTIDA